MQMKLLVSMQIDSKVQRKETIKKKIDYRTQRIRKGQKTQISSINR